MENYAGFTVVCTAIEVAHMAYAVKHAFKRFGVTSRLVVSCSLFFMEPCRTVLQIQIKRTKFIRTGIISYSLPVGIFRSQCQVDGTVKGIVTISNRIAWIIVFKGKYVAFYFYQAAAGLQSCFTFSLCFNGVHSHAHVDCAAVCGKSVVIA